MRFTLGFVPVCHNEPTITSPTVFVQGQPTDGLTIDIICLSEGGYPQQSVDWFMDTVSIGTRLTGAINFVINLKRTTSQAR